MFGGGSSRNVAPRKYVFTLAQPSFLSYFSSVDPNDQKKTACYDIDVEVDDPLKAQMSNFLASTTNQQEIASLDVKVRLCQLE